jgi:RNase P subunit RPR2
MEIEDIRLCIYRVLLKTNNLHENMENCINFAFKLLDNNIETENVYILAGLHEDEYYDIKNFFLNVLSDLNISIDIYDKYLGIKYLTLVASEVIDGKIDSIDAVKELSGYNENVFFDKNFIYDEYNELMENINLIRDDNISLIPGMDKNNIKEYIKHHFELFIEAQKIGVPKGIYEEAYCKKCRKRIRPKLVQKLFKRCSDWKCPECGYNRFYWIKFNEGMNLYLKELEKN